MNERRHLLKSLASLGLATPLVSLATPLSQTPSSAPSAQLSALRYRISGPDHFPPSFNPLTGNPLTTRADVVQGIKDLYLPLTPYYSRGGARVRLDMAGAMFDQTAADLEGFARPLWGLAPLAIGGGADFVDWDIFRRGLANGTDPEHTEYWGACTDRDQRMVELAAIGFALTLIPHILWQPQTEQAKRNIAAYLQNAYARSYINNNWMFFRLMIGLGLQSMVEPVDKSLMADYAQQISAYYMGQGWYQDGAFRRADHYVAFAFNFYALIYSRLGSAMPGAERFRQRAKELAPEFIHWFAEDGAALPFGRSLTYRFACASYWSALAFADEPVLPWGQIKGLVLRHLRWWSKQPIAHRDGILSLGYAYPNQQIVETYSSACSPYWAFKVFAFMALPETHPFWTSKEEALPQFNTPATLPHPGMVIFHPGGDSIALCGGQEENKPWMRLGAEKYSKFAYSAHYGFGVETIANQFDAAGLDNMLGFSTDGLHFRVRESNQQVRIADQLIYACWAADEDIRIETWLIPASPWHLRIHRIRSGKTCQVHEGGFAIARNPGDQALQISGASCMQTPTDISGIIDLGSSIRREGRVIESVPNSNLIYPRASIPQLCCTIRPGETILQAAILVLGDPKTGRQAWNQVPTAPSISELEYIIRNRSVAVTLMKN